jgi:hypothetical protein
MMFCNTQSTTSDFWLMRIDEIGRPQEVEAALARIEEYD